MRSRLRWIAAAAFVAAATLLVLLLAGDRSPRPEARPFEIDLTQVHALEYHGIFRDTLEPAREPWTPSTLPSGMRRHEKDTWRWGYRSCRKSWQELVASIGLTGLLPRTGPESEEQLEWLAWRLLYSSGLDLSQVNTNNFNYGVQGCVDGFNSFPLSSGARGGIDAAP